METKSIEERIVHVLRHLGISQAHVAASMSADWRGLATRYTDLIASLTLVCPTGLDPNDVSRLSCGLLVFAGDQGPQRERLQRSLASFRDATLITLPNYLGETWSDVIADRTREVGEVMLEWLQRVDKLRSSKNLNRPGFPGGSVT
jgi:hypothetical protein